MLYLIGLGLCDEYDLTLKAVDTLRKVDRIYLETYTSFYNGSVENLERLCGKKIIQLSRSELEEHPEDNVLSEGVNALLVLGDPFCATTHCDIYLRAREIGKDVKIIHNTSIFSAVAECGLQLYKFGKTTTIAYPEGEYFPMSPYDVLVENKDLHTLCLLDVKEDERRYMSIGEALTLLQKMEDVKNEKVIAEDSMCIGLARIGGDQKIRYGRVVDLLDVDFGGPPHTLIIPGKLHFKEEEMLEQFKI